MGPCSWAFRADRVLPPLNSFLDRGFRRSLQASWSARVAGGFGGRDRSDNRRLHDRVGGTALRPPSAARGAAAAARATASHGVVRPWGRSTGETAVTGRGRRAFPRLFVRVFLLAGMVMLRRFARGPVQDFPTLHSILPTADGGGTGPTLPGFGLWAVHGSPQPENLARKRKFVPRSAVLPSIHHSGGHRRKRTIPSTVRAVTGPCRRVPDGTAGICKAGI